MKSIHLMIRRCQLSMRQRLPGAPDTFHRHAGKRPKSKGSDQPKRGKAAHSQTQQSRTGRRADGTRDTPDRTRPSRKVNKPPQRVCRPHSPGPSQSRTPPTLARRFRTGQNNFERAQNQFLSLPAAYQHKWYSYRSFNPRSLASRIRARPRRRLLSSCLPRSARLAKRSNRRPMRSSEALQPVASSWPRFMSGAVIGWEAVSPADARRGDASAVPVAPG